MASRPGRRVVYNLSERSEAVEFRDLLVLVIKMLPDAIKLALLVAEKIKNKHRPPSQG